jgi:hypothetical protein
VIRVIGVTAALVALALTAGARMGRGDSAPPGSITVKLPPARPAAPAPGFLFEAAKPARP